MQGLHNLVTTLSFLYGLPPTLNNMWYPSKVAFKSLLDMQVAAMEYSYPLIHIDIHTHMRKRRRERIEKGSRERKRQKGVENDYLRRNITTFHCSLFIFLKTLRYSSEDLSSILDSAKVLQQRSIRVWQMKMVHQ